MNTESRPLNIRLSPDLLQRVDRVRLWLSTQMPGATRTDAVRMVLQKGLESLESATEGRMPEDRAWMGQDLSRLSEFEPYDFGGADPERLGQPVHRLPDGAFEVETGR